VIINAEEYLEPTRNDGTTSINTCSTNGTLKRTGPDGSWPDSPQNFHHRYRERQRYGAGGSGRAPSTIDSRYCSDPLNILGKDTSDGCYSDSSARSRQANVGNLKLDLPVDDDDYLMPSPHTNTNATTYLDVVGDPKAKHQGTFTVRIDSIDVKYG
jgi:hypothetical protein